MRSATENGEASVSTAGNPHSTSGADLLYDGACGTGGMLTVAEETLQELAVAHDKEVVTHLYGQEINAETYAICKSWKNDLERMGGKGTLDSRVREY